MQNERAFHPEFLNGCTDMELVLMQHELRKFPEDALYLQQVLTELGHRLLVATADPVLSTLPQETP